MLEKTYFIYTRISKEGEYDKSLYDQFEILTKKAKENKINKTIQYEDIESGYTGSKRENFNEMMEILIKDSKLPIEKRKYGGVLFFKIDRLSRNNEDFIKIEKLLNNGYKFISATETIENTPTGRLLFRMLSAYAIFESDKLSSRMIMSKIYSSIKKDLRSLGGKLPFGYIYKGTSKFPEVVKVEAKIINEIYDLRLAGHEFKQITQIIKDKYEKILENYLLSKDRGYEDDEVFLKTNTSITSKEQKFIQNIIYNNSPFKYNGFIKREFTVKDEIIQDIISKNMNNEEIYSIDGSNEIDSKIKIIFYEPALIIISEEKYKQINNLKEIKQKKEKESGLYENKVYIIIDNVEYKTRTEIGSKNHKSYKKDINGTSSGLSELKIEETIKQSKSFNKVFSKEKLKSGILVDVENHIKHFSKNKLKRLICEKNRIINEIDRVSYLISTEHKKSNLKLLKQYNKELQLYQDSKNLIENEIYQLEKDTTKFVEYFFNIFDKDFFNKDYNYKRIGYKIILDKIVINEDKTLSIYFKKFISKILGIPHQINL